jgi:hypothetical protein
VRQARANGGAASRGVPRRSAERWAPGMLKIGLDFYILASSLASRRSRGYWPAARALRSWTPAETF